jgi:hypothetical protein
MDHAPNSPAKSKSIWPMFAGAFVIFALFAVVVQFLVNSGDREAFDEEAIRAKERYEILKKIEDENNNLTTGYAWADRAKGTVRIPLDRAMELAVAKLSAQGEPKPAGAIDLTVPHASAVKPGGLAAPQPTPPPFNARPAPAATPAPPAATNAPAQP